MFLTACLRPSKNMNRTLVLLAIMACAGCAAPASITGGSAQREQSTIQSATFPPYPPAYPQRITESPATRPAFTREVVFYPPAAPAAATVMTATFARAATTQPSASGDDRLALKGGEIRPDGTLAGFSASSIPIPQPRSGWWVYLLAVSFVVLGVATFKFIHKGVGTGLILLAPVVFLLEPLMLTVLLIVLAVLATLVAVYFAFRHGQLQKTVQKVDAAFAGFVGTANHPDPNIAVQASLNDQEQVVLPKTVAAARAVSTLPVETDEPPGPVNTK
jgi:hypothetical protein